MEIEKHQNIAILKDVSLNHSTQYLGEEQNKFSSLFRKNYQVEKNEEKESEKPLQIKSEFQIVPKDSPNFPEFKIFIEPPQSPLKSKEKNSKRSKLAKEKKLQSYFLAYQNEKLGNSIDQCAKSKFFQYYHHRNQMRFLASKQPINLKVFSLYEVLRKAVDKNIIPYQVFLNFEYKIHSDPQNSFVYFLENNSLNQYDFQHLTFCPVDHRVICFYLVSKYPNQFIFPTYVLSTNKNLTNFYSFLYDLSDEEFFKIYDELRTRYNRHWMPKSARIMKAGRSEEEGFSELFYFGNVRKLRKN